MSVQRRRRRFRQLVAVTATAAAVTLAWPGPSGADTSLGGYSGAAQAMPVRIQIYEPTIPIPASPQVDGGVAFTRSTTDTGPVSRALASYLWPGDTVGDGFSQLVGGDTNYPVQVNSRYPATPTSPAQNTSQLTDGNGMTTLSNEEETKATVTGLGITGTNVVTNPLQGFPPGQATTASAAPKAPALPVPVSGQLAGLVSIGAVTSTSDVTVGAKSITSTAHAAVSDIAIAGGILTINDVSLTSTSTSDGTKGTSTSTLTMGGLSVAGQPVALTADGVDLAGTKLKLPALPDLLGKLGFTLTYAPTVKQADGASSAFEASGLVISIDTRPIKDMLGAGSVLDALGQLLSKIPNAGSQLQGLTNLGPKIVITIGNVSSSATAAPAYTGGGAGGTATPPPATGGGAGVGGIGSGGTTGGGNFGVGGVPAAGGTGGTGAGTSTGPAPTVAAAPAAMKLPPLGAVPKLLLLGGIVLAAAIGWALRAAALGAFGGSRHCAMGLATGVPDLRKG